MLPGIGNLYRRFTIVAFQNSKNDPQKISNGLERTVVGLKKNVRIFTDFDNANIKIAIKPDARNFSPRD